MHACRHRSSSPVRRSKGGEGSEHADWLVTLGEQLGGLQAQMQATASTASLHAVQQESEIPHSCMTRLRLATHIYTCTLQLHWPFTPMLATRMYTCDSQVQVTSTLATHTDAGNSPVYACCHVSYVAAASQLHTTGTASLLFANSVCAFFISHGLLRLEHLLLSTSCLLAQSLSAHGNHHPPIIFHDAWVHQALAQTH